MRRGSAIGGQAVTDRGAAVNGQPLDAPPRQWSEAERRAIALETHPHACQCRHCIDLRADGAK